ncbi:DOPA 4,5-dioxygenase family protein [Aliivibrio salmonicida]|uniref:DOPA 4,5-dioxygenase family protein n=1 Tax=Aliivibrio salmonicida TaxID=40269 RepID=UPI003D0C0093
MKNSEHNGFHVHVYFNEHNIDCAVALTEALYKAFGFEIGNINTKPIGPHPVWSRQVSFKEDDYQAVFQWLEENRSDLSILIHPLTEDEYRDHTESAVWLGKPINLDLTIF